MGDVVERGDVVWCEWWRKGKKKEMRSEEKFVKRKNFTTGNSQNAYKYFVLYKLTSITVQCSWIAIKNNKNNNENIETNYEQN